MAIENGVCNTKDVGSVQVIHELHDEIHYCFGSVRRNSYFYLAWMH